MDSSNQRKKNLQKNIQSTYKIENINELKEEKSLHKWIFRIKNE